MIRRLRIKFVCINMSIVTGMLLVIFGILLVSTGEDLRRQSMQTVQQAMMELGFSQRPGDPENTMPGGWEPRGGDGWNVGRQTANGLLGCCTPISAADAKPGDLIFFQGTYNTTGASHVGIYVGDGMMLHCGNPIQYTSINTSYWQEHFYTYGRII